MAQKHALIAGATGLVGGEVLQELIRGRQYHTITLLTRREVDTNSKRVENLIVDFDDFTADDLPEVDDVFCCLGTTIKKAGSKEAFKQVDYHYPLKLARLSLKRGAQQYLLVSAMGADKNSRIFYNQVKGEVEEAVAGEGFKTLHIFRPSILLGERDEQRFGEQIAQIAMQGVAPVMVGNFKKYRPIEAYDIAKAMVHVAKKELEGTFVFESDKIQALAKLS